MQPDLAPMREDANGDIPGCALLGYPHQRWRRDASQPPEVLQLRQERDTCVHIPVGRLRCVSWNTRGGLLGSIASSQVSGDRSKSTSNS